MAQAASSYDPSQADSLQSLLNDHLKFLRLKGYSEYTIRSRHVHIRLFLAWCRQNGIFRGR